MVLARIVAPSVKKIAVLQSAAKPTGLAVARFAHGYGDGGRPFYTTMNDLPTPSGSWEEDYKSKQAKYNMHLFAGIAFTIVTAIVAKSSGLLYGNWSPPPYPSEE